MDLRYRDDQLAVRDAVREFVRDRIVPRAAEWSEQGVFPMPLLPELASVGLTGLTIPPEHGGSGLDALTTALVAEELGAGDGSIALTLAAHNSLCIGHLLTAASAEQRARWLPPLARGDLPRRVGPDRAERRDPTPSPRRRPRRRTATAGS